ncbi:MAG TPA: hypothetical protein VGR05_04835, partial [Sphingomicrobium sp.]|nr:hypothetical protein [Sphingomicrobium sp.]
PPLLLVLWAHLLRPFWPNSDWFAVIAAGLIGMAAVATAPWRDRTRAVIAVVYIVLLWASLPFVGLLAVCSTGDCL